MPELPEVETTRRGVEPHCLDRRVRGVVVREPRLRWPVPADLDQRLRGHTIRSVQRRAKYLLFDTEVGTLLVHLGMSGSLRVVQADSPDQIPVETAMKLCDRHFGVGGDGVLVLSPPSSETAAVSKVPPPRS